MGLSASSGFRHRIWQRDLASALDGAVDAAAAGLDALGSTDLTKATPQDDRIERRQYDSYPQRVAADGGPDGGPSEQSTDERHRDRDMTWA